MKLATNHPIAVSIALLFIVAVSYSLLRMKLNSQSMKSFIEEAGLDDTPEIIGGAVVNTARYPYYCFIRYRERGRYFRLCGGTLIHDDMVLTAAHCQYVSGTKTKLTDIFVYCGIDSSFNPDNPTGDGIRVQETFPATNYSPHTGAYDYALLKLESRITNVQKVTLNRDSSVPRVGQTTTAAGFGYITSSGPSSSVLKEVNLRVYGTYGCSYDPYYTYVESVMMCAWTLAQGVCYGDSGGPLIIPGADASSDVQVGISSFVAAHHGGCADRAPNHYDYFARVSGWYDEIVDIVCRNSAVPSASPLCSSGSGGSGGGSGTCHDVPGWLDTHGTPCWWYAQGNKCQVYGIMEQFRNDGKRAVEACCACGGGVRS